MQEVVWDNCMDIATCNQLVATPGGEVLAAADGKNFPPRPRFAGGSFLFCWEFLKKTIDTMRIVCDNELSDNADRDGADFPEKVSKGNDTGTD